VDNKTILFSHHVPFLPLIKSLRSEFDIQTITPQFSQELTNLEIPAKALRDFAAGQQDGAFTWAAHCIRDLPDIVESMNGKYPGLGFFQQNGFPFYYPRLADLGVAVLALDQAKPDLIVVHNDVEPVHRAVALWARERGVPCLHVPHAIYQLVNRTPLGTDVHDIVTASYLAVAGQFQQEWYEKCGADPTHIIQTGLPQFDQWANREQHAPAEARKMLGLNPSGPPVVTYIGTWGQHTNIRGVSDEWQVNYLAFLEAVRDIDVQVLLKVHPRGGQDNWNWYGKQAQEAGVVVLATKDYLDIIIDASDVLLAYGGSNVVLEAAHNPRVRLLTTHGYVDDTAVGKVPITDPEGIRAGIIKAIGSKAPDTGILRGKYLGRCDGHNTERVEALCRELVR